MKDEKNFTPFYASFLRLCERKGKSPTAVAKIAGISSGAPTAWKKGAIPKPEQRRLLCLFFEVTDEELLGYKKEPISTNEDGFAENEKELIHFFRLLPEDLQAGILAQIKAVLIQRKLLPPQ